MKIVYYEESCYARKRGNLSPEVKNILSNLYLEEVENLHLDGIGNLHDPALIVLEEEEVQKVYLFGKLSSDTYVLFKVLSSSDFVLFKEGDDAKSWFFERIKDLTK